MSELELELDRVVRADAQHTSEAKATCAKCGEPFTPRGPGKPQKFCSVGCRRAYHDRGDGAEGAAVKRANDATFENEPEALDHPPPETGSYIDHRPNGGPLLHVPESTLKHIDAIGREMAAEDRMKSVVYRLARAGATPEQVQIVEQCLSEADEGEPQGFDWSDDESICLPDQAGIAVYETNGGDICIRQYQRAPAEDLKIFVRAQNLQPLIDRLCDLAGIGGAGRPPRER